MREGKLDTTRSDAAMVKIERKVKMKSPLKPAPTDIPYYHATFRSRATSILVEGLRTDAPRLWTEYARCTKKFHETAGGENHNPYYDYVYLMEIPEFAVMWVLAYLVTETEGKRDSFGREYSDFHKLEPDGITIFEVDPTGLKIMSGMSDDFVVRGNIPTENLKIYGVVDPHEVWELAELHHLFKTDGYLEKPYYGSGAFLGVEFNNRKIPVADKMEIMLDRIYKRITTVRKV